MPKWLSPYSIALSALILTGCLGVPDGITTVDNVDLNKYLGTWYEIARLDHRFERGLDRVTATYSMREDGGIRVENRGYDIEDQSWDSAIGKAYLQDGETARLKVSFFGPFYGAYNIIKLDADYRYAVVTGPSRDYLWILSRTPTLPEATVTDLVSELQQLDYATDQLIYPSHTSAENLTH